MTTKGGASNNRPEKIDRDRRKLLKLAAAGSTGLITSPWTFQSSRAAPKTIKIGQITPETGPIAAFGEPSKWVAEEVTKFLGGHLEVAGEKHPIQILNRDSQSNPNRASDVAADLINNDRVDIMIASSTGDTTNPVADQCELAGVMLTNDPDGIAASDPVHGLPATIKGHGFDVHYLGLYPPLSDDFTAQITQLKNMKADIACGIFNPPQFAIFWTQCAQQGFQPKIVTPPKALLFPTAVEALGNRGAGMSTEVWWSHHHPFKSGLTGQTAQQFCDAYEKASGKQWTQPLGFKHANLEVAIDVLKRAKKLNADSIREAIADTDYKSIVGPITWKAGPGPLNPVPNVCTTPIVGGQWEKGAKWKYDLNIVFNKSAPEIPLDRPFSAISYS